MKILITGANGFIGKHLCGRLKSHGYDVVEFAQDLTKPFSLTGHFDVVVHLAAYNITNIGTKDVERYNAVNVEGTRHLLEAVKADRFIYMSTSKVYKNEGQPLTEASPLGPQGAYEQSKLKAEEVCRDMLKKESLVILRSVNCLGQGQAPKAVVPVFFARARAQESLDIMGSPKTPMQFVYVEDLVDAIEAVIDYKSAGGIFNIANDETFTLEQLARDIITFCHSSSVINIQETAKSVFSPVVCAKAHQQLGWKAKTGLKEILKSYAQA